MLTAWVQGDDSGAGGEREVVDVRSDVVEADTDGDTPLGKQENTIDEDTPLSPLSEQTQEDSKDVAFVVEDVRGALTGPHARLTGRRRIAEARLKRSLTQDEINELKNKMGYH